MNAPVAEKRIPFEKDGVTYTIDCEGWIYGPDGEDLWMTAAEMFPDNLAQIEVQLATIQEPYVTIEMVSEQSETALLVPDQTAHVQKLPPLDQTFYLMSRVDQIRLTVSFLLKSRRNVITRKYDVCEYSPLPPDGEKWEALTENKINSIWSTLSRNYFPKRLDIGELRRVIESDFSTDYDPIQKYFTALPPWDGRDYFDEICKLITPSPDQYGTDRNGKKINADEILKLYFSKWFVGMVGSLLGGEHNDTSFTLVGSGGIGKTRLLRKLGIDEQLTYVGYINPADKDHRLLFATKTLIVLDEIEATTKHDLAALKSGMTLKYVSLRPAYGHFDETYKRIASFCACANDVQILTDVTGSRRWLCVECDDIQYDKLTPQLVHGAYSQAREALNAGFKTWFDRDDIEDLTQHNERFQAANHEEESVKKLFDPAKKEDPRGVLLTTTEILTEISNRNPAIKFSSKKLGQTLRKLNFRRVQRSSDHLYAYYVVKRYDD